MKLRSKRTDPPGHGWLYMADDGTEITAPLYDLLIHKVIKHYEVNGRFETCKNKKTNVKIYSRQDIVIDVEDQICRRSPPGFCEGEHPKGPRLGIDDIMAGTKSLLSLLVLERYCNIEEAEERAAICATCKFNNNYWGCWGCFAAYNIVRRKLTRRTRFSHLLKACSICGCVLEAKVHCSKNIIKKYATKKVDEYPDHCWCKKILNNNE